MHRAIRATLRELFGAAGDGVADPLRRLGEARRTPREILHAAEVGGALVGGASLKADDFLGIIRAL